MTDKTEKYIVTKRHTLGHKIGAVIELTESKAQSLVGKVRLASEDVSVDESAVIIGKLQSEINELTAEVEKLKVENKTLDAKVKVKAK